MLKKLRLLVTGYIIFMIISGIIAVFNDKSISGKLGGIFLALVFILILYIVIYYWYGSEHKCPSCHKRFCLKKEGTDILDKEPTSKLVETKIKNNQGDVIGTNEQYISGQRITYQANYVCTKCGERCSSTYQKDVF